ncbi:hypothetical protein DFO53_0896 [Enterobacter sp. AG5470]|nr:hypothetical protein DFO53_0896 [Enterobacter sp. AG5470]
MIIFVFMLAHFSYGFVSQYWLVIYGRTRNESTYLAWSASCES